MASAEEQAALFLQSFDFDASDAPAATCLSDADIDAESRWYEAARALEEEGDERQGSPGLDWEVPSPEDLGFESATSERERPLPAAKPKSPAPVSSSCGTAAYDEVVRQRAVSDLFKRRRLDLPGFPWDEPQWGAASLLKSRLTAAPTVGIIETIQQAGTKTAEPMDASSVPWTVTKRLQRTRVVRSEDEVRDSALKRLKVLVLLDPEATALGQSLLRMGMELEEDEKISQSISDAFRAKASTTLQKRALSLQAFVVRAYDLGFDSPWRLSEGQMYAVFCKLRDDGSKPSTAQHVIEALNFFNGICKFVFMSLDDVVASRTRGVARDLALKRGPISQRDPLTLEQVRALEAMMMRDDRPTWQKCFVGVVLFCTHASVRWGDAQRVTSLELMGSGAAAILMGLALGSKTSLRVEAKRKFLPYACVASGVSGEPWAAAWLDARGSENLDFEAGLIPSWSQREGAWASHAMPSEEACDYLVEILLDLGVSTPGRSIGTHSCKATVLSWAHWSPKVRFTQAEHRLLGHHIKRGSSNLIYSRQLYIELAGKCLAMYRSIRCGDFDPDQTTESRVAAIAAAYDEPGTLVPDPTLPAADEEGASPSEASVSAESGAEPVVREIPPGDRVRLPFEDCDLDELRVHTLSGIVHRLKSQTHFACGRLMTDRYRRFGRDDQDDPDTCFQCKWAKS